MKIIIAPDSFKGSIEATQICDLLEKNILNKKPNAHIIKMPLGDGGEGTEDAFYTAYPKSFKKEVIIKDLFGRKKSVHYIINGEEAYIETALAVGLDKTRLDVMHSSSEGVGQMILSAQKNGIKRIYLGLGGSGTCDAGTGALAEMGLHFYDAQNNTLKPCGESLESIYKISGEIKNLTQMCEFFAVADVQNPLYGENGAAYVYAPQKGADQQDVQVLDRGLRNFAKVSGYDNVANSSGSGAAGGLGFFIKAYLNAKIISGIDFVLDLYKYDEIDADLIITGEGCIDEQTLYGKTVSGVLRRANGRRVLAICGKTGIGCKNLGCEVVSINPPDEPPEISMKNVIKNLSDFNIDKYL